MIWTARLIYRANELRPSQLRSIRAALKQYASVEHDAAAQRLHITLDVESGSIHEAAAIAVETAGAAPAMPAQPIRMDLMSQESFEVETAQPAPLDLDLMRITDIAELLGVSRQRVDQLASQDPDFPPAVALIGRRGQAYSRQTIEEYARRREPRPGRRRPST